MSEMPSVPELDKNVTYVLSLTSEQIEQVCHGLTLLASEFSNKSVRPESREKGDLYRKYAMSAWELEDYIGSFCGISWE